MELAWPTISNKRAMAVSQSWESNRTDPSGALLKTWQAETLPVVVAGCGGGCSAGCTNKNANCSMWAKKNQCEENPGYMHAMCPLSCPSASNQKGWKLSSDGTVKTPGGDCLDAAGQLPAADAGLNWLRTAKCDPDSPTQKWLHPNNTNTLKSKANGLCLGVMSHWLWPQPMVSLLGCGGSKTDLTFTADGMLTSSSGYGCFGVSTTQGPASGLWRKPMAGGKTAVLAINAAALPNTITIDVGMVLAPDASLASGVGVATEATATDVWTGQSLGEVTNVSRVVPPHGNIFIVLE
jgi:hypothetical protein